MKKVCALLGVAAVLALCASPASAVIINVARQGTASASSEAYGGAPARGIDGGLGPSWTLDATTTHTGDSAFSWWQVDLGGAMPITQVDLYNRGDCCNPDRLGDFRVNVLDAPGGSVVYSEHYPGDVGVGNAASINLPAGVVGQVVQVQLVGENGGANDGLNNAGSGFLSLREVVVLGQTTVPNGANLAALYGVADQISTLNNSHRPGAHRAIDGNTSGVFNNSSVSHTNSAANAWWEVDLTASAPIDNIVVWERADTCCNQRLNNFSVTVLDAARNELFRQDVTGNVGRPFGVPVTYGTEGRYVRVEFNDTGTARTLELAEVQVIGSEPGILNVARNPKAVADQSSDRIGSGGNVASVAIDGITNGIFQGTNSQNSVTHTLSELEPSWWVELGQGYPLEEIVLWNRADCCGDRLSDFEVAVLNGGINGALVWANDFFETGSVPQGGSFAIELPDGTFGDTVRVKLNDNGTARVLSLAEVQVWATPEPTTLSLLGLGGLALLRRRRRQAAR